MQWLQITIVHLKNKQALGAAFVNNRETASKTRK